MSAATGTAVSLHGTRANLSLDGLRQDLVELRRRAEELLDALESLQAQSKAIAAEEVWAWTQEPFGFFEGVFRTIEHAIAATQPGHIGGEDGSCCDFDDMLEAVDNAVDMLDQARSRAAA